MLLRSVSSLVPTRTKTLIGFTTLLNLRLAVDPVHRRLLPVDRIVLLDEEDTQ